VDDQAVFDRRANRVSESVVLDLVELRPGLSQHERSRVNLQLESTGPNEGTPERKTKGDGITLSTQLPNSQIPEDYQQPDY
jgi:hypothetical protein